MKKIVLTSGTFLVFAYLFINGLFVYKYGARIGAPAFHLVPAYVLFAAGLCVILRKMPESIFGRSVFAAVVVLFVLVSVLLFRIKPQAVLNVDRYEMIRLFWDNALSGKNPYLPRHENTNIPGPFPFYFLLAFPFYWTGEIGIFSLAGFLLFAALLFSSRTCLKNKTAALLLLTASPAFVYEIICRSTVFLNAALVLCWMVWVERSTPGTASKKFCAGLLLGCLLSTRSVAWFMFAPFLAVLYRNRRGWFEGGRFSAGAFLAVLVIFLPFFFFNSFRHGVNPFRVQESLVPAVVTVPIWAAFFLASHRIRSFRRFLIAEAFFTFFLLSAYMGGKIAHYGWNSAVYQHRADISYWLFVFPFLIHAFFIADDDPAGEGARVNPSFKRMG